MALTNIFREPRREITEQVVGAALVVPAIVLCVWATVYFGGSVYACPALKESPCWIGAAVTLPAILLAIIIGLTVIHGIGDAACNALQRRGLHLRPRVRY